MVFWELVDVAVEHVLASFSWALLGWMAIDDGSGVVWGDNECREQYGAVQPKKKS
jgi:hypothetical protein